MKQWGVDQATAERDLAAAKQLIALELNAIAGTVLFARRPPSMVPRWLGITSNGPSFDKEE